MASTSGDRLLTVAEVAEVLRVSGMTVYRLIEKGELRALRIGARWRVSSADLDEYLAGARVGVSRAS